MTRELVLKEQQRKIAGPFINQTYFQVIILGCRHFFEINYKFHYPTVSTGPYTPVSHQFNRSEVTPFSHGTRELTSRNRPCIGHRPMSHDTDEVTSSEF